MSEKIKDKAKETVQPEISVEQLQTENGALKNRVAELEAKELSATETAAERNTLLNENQVLKDHVTELETENGDLKKDIEKLKEVRDLQDAKIAELSAEEYDTSTLRKVDKEGNVKIKFLLSPAGKFLLPYNVGQVVSHPANQADEMVDLKYAEYGK
jgi:seryl-tRNA synthetase